MPNKLPPVEKTKTKYRKLVLAGVGLGANLGEKEKTIREAIRRIDALPECDVIATSPLITTKPVGYLDQPDFLNGALILETTLDASELLVVLLSVEDALGRTREIDKGPRTIDLDLLFFGDAVIEQKEPLPLQIPHPEMHKRPFVLEPLAHIAPQWTHPRLEKSVKAMLADCEQS